MWIEYVKILYRETRFISYSCNVGLTLFVVEVVVEVDVWFVAEMAILGLDPAPRSLRSPPPRPFVRAAFVENSGYTSLASRWPEAKRSASSLFRGLSLARRRFRIFFSPLALEERAFKFGFEFEFPVLLLWPPSVWLSLNLGSDSNFSCQFFFHIRQG